MVNIVTIYWNVQVQEIKKFKNNFVKRIKVQLNILIVHPEGNINFNQNLLGIVEILCELGNYVEIACRKRNFYQFSPHGNSRIFFYDTNIPRQEFSDWKLIIGVDRDGVIEAAKIARILSIPYIYLSYELFFEDETSVEFKDQEREACLHISAAIAQDSERAKLLCKETNIDPNKILLLPFGGRPISQQKRNLYLREKFGISVNKKIALMMGGLHHHTLYQKIVETLKAWPQDWVFVLHGRYGIEGDLFKFLNEFTYYKNFYLSHSSLENQSDLETLLGSADLGIALYKATYHSEYDGKNIKYIGMASGKIATYLQHGLPVMTNEIGILSEYVKEYHLGVVVKKPIDIPLSLCNFDPTNLRGNCVDFFDEHLSLDKLILPLLGKIIELIENEAG